VCEKVCPLLLKSPQRRGEGWRKLLGSAGEKAGKTAESKNLPLLRGFYIEKAWQ
jgi:hypothetical protein